MIDQTHIAKQTFQVRRFNECAKINTNVNEFLTTSSNGQCDYEAKSLKKTYTTWRWIIPSKTWGGGRTCYGWQRSSTSHCRREHRKSLIRSGPIDWKMRTACPCVSVAVQSMPVQQVCNSRTHYVRSMHASLSTQQSVQDWHVSRHTGDHTIGTLASVVAIDFDCVLNRVHVP